MCVYKCADMFACSTHTHTHTHIQRLCALCVSPSKLLPLPPSQHLSPLFVPLALSFSLPSRSPACQHYFKPLPSREGGRARQRHTDAQLEREWRGEGKADRIQSSSARAENRLNRGEPEQKGNQEKERQGLETKHTVALSPLLTSSLFSTHRKRRYQL